MDVYTEHENFATLLVLFHYKSILLSLLSSPLLCSPLFVSGSLAPTFFTSHAFDWPLHQTWFPPSTANRARDANETPGSAKNAPPYKIPSSSL
jgi:hypothetical protein